MPRERQDQFYRRGRLAQRRNDANADQADRTETAG
jgi:hypothetical protein